MSFRYLKLSRNAIGFLYHNQFSFRIENCRKIHLSSCLSLKTAQCLHSEQPATAKISNERDKRKKLLQRIPRGTLDRNPQQMALQQYVLDKITSIFQKHGAETIDTPVFEYKDVLTEKYGEDSKLIYDLRDEGDETLSMRYDLTVSLARYVAMYRIGHIKRYQIGKVYRGDSPILTHGRYCEFLQCDFDIVGTHDPMLPDAECIKVIAEILNSLDIGDYVIKLNHRQLLDGIFIACGVPADKFRAICAAVDKLDKKSWLEVRREMIKEKGLDESIADKIGKYIKLNGGFDLIDRLLNDEYLKSIPTAIAALESMKLLLQYCEIFELKNKICFDLSLARGLDYYTGTIVEAVLKGNDYGSIAGGGRYDNLVGMFDVKGKSIPCIGISIGVERIFLLLEEKFKKIGKKFRTNNADVFVVTPHRGMGEERLKLVNKLWDAGIRCENSNKLSPKILVQLQHCEEYDIPIALILGKSELERGIVKLREVQTRHEEDVPLDILVDEIRKKLEKINS